MSVSTEAAVGPLSLSLSLSQLSWPVRSSQTRARRCDQLAESLASVGSAESTVSTEQYRLGEEPVLSQFSSLLTHITASTEQPPSTEENLENCATPTSY